MEEIATALAALQDAITAANVSELTFNSGDYRIVVSQAGELISVTRR